MENQYIFDDNYCTDIKRQFRNEDYSSFHEDYFDYDDNRVIKCKYARPEGLLERMLAYPVEDFFHPAKELYEAYSDLTGIQATYDPFWAYLSLVDLYKYTIRQYPQPQEYKSQYALNHFMVCKYTAYNLRGLWWAMKMTVRKNSDGTNDYTLSEFFLNGHSQLTQSLSESQLFRCREVVQGVVLYFYEHSDDCHRDIINGVLKYLNMLGSIKQLACLPSSYFKTLLTEQVPIIKADLNRSQKEENKSTIQKIVSIIKGE